MNSRLTCGINVSLQSSVIVKAKKNNRKIRFRKEISVIIKNTFSILINMIIIYRIDNTFSSCSIQEYIHKSRRNVDCCADMYRCEPRVVASKLCQTSNRDGHCEAYVHDRITE